jgi:hypothetical protein
VIQSVPRTYAAIQFRSTLEADWACTLDALGVAWCYEPEAVRLPSGEHYRPDFWLPALEVWLEVKGPNVPGLEKTYEFARSVLQLVVIGRPAIRGIVDFGWCDGPGIVRGDCYVPDLVMDALGWSANRHFDTRWMPWPEPVGEPNMEHYRRFVKAPDLLPGARRRPSTS